MACSSRKDRVPEFARSLTESYDRLIAARKEEADKAAPNLDQLDSLDAFVKVVGESAAWEEPWEFFLAHPEFAPPYWPTKLQQFFAGSRPAAPAVSFDLKHHKTD